jgi:hypothetical protein
MATFAETSLHARLLIIWIAILASTPLYASGTILQAPPHIKSMSFNDRFHLERRFGFRTNHIMNYMLANNISQGTHIYDSVGHLAQTVWDFTEDQWHAAVMNITQSFTLYNPELPKTGTNSSSDRLYGLESLEERDPNDGVRIFFATTLDLGGSQKT